MLSTNRASIFALAALVAMLGGCGGSSGPTVTVKDRVELTEELPVAVVEFEGSIVVAASANDEMVADFFQVRPRNSDDFDSGNVGRFTEETWVDGSWVVSLPGAPVDVLLSAGSNRVRYRWTFELAEGEASGVIPFEVDLGAAYRYPLESAPTADEISDVSLRVVSVSHP